VVLVGLVPATPLVSVDSVPVVDIVELVRSVVPTLELLGFDDVGRPVLPTLEPVLLWVVDVESPLEESAWATVAAPASEAQTPTVRAPVPSHTATLL
jgi:hypothetical protein